MSDRDTLIEKLYYLERERAKYQTAIDFQCAMIASGYNVDDEHRLEDRRQCILQANMGIGGINVQIADTQAQLYIGKPNE